VVAAPHALPAAPAKPAGAHYRLQGLQVEGGTLHVQTSGGTPPYTLVGITRNRLVVDLANTSVSPDAAEPIAASGTFRSVQVVSSKPGAVRLVIETDGTQRLVAKLDRRERLQLVSAPWGVVPALPEASDEKPAPAAKPEKAQPAHKPRAARHKHTAPAPRVAMTRLQDVTVGDGELVVHTTGAAPRFIMQGGTKKRLVIDLPHAGIKAPGKLFPVKSGGVEQVRAVLFKNRPMTIRLVIDTDGSVRLSPFMGPDGLLHVRMTGIAKPQVAQAPKKAEPVKPEPKKPEPAPVASKPGKAEAAKPVVADKPVPHASATPMAVPHQGKPAAKADKAETAKKPLAKPSAAPSAFPEAAMTESDEPHLQRSLSSSYRFPIERERTTGRANPFKVLPNRARPKPAPLDKPGLAALPVVPSGHAPTLPLPGVPAANMPPNVPAAPAAGVTAKAYTLSAVIVGGGAAPVAMIKVDGKTCMVGLNETLPGNARVKSIQADYVILTSNDQDIRLGLKK
jgi:hypothetical protein